MLPHFLFRLPVGINFSIFVTRQLASGGAPTRQIDGSSESDVSLCRRIFVLVSLFADSPETSTFFPKNEISDLVSANHEQPARNELNPT